MRRWWYRSCIVDGRWAARHDPKDPGGRIGGAPVVHGRPPARPGQAALRAAALLVTFLGIAAAAYAEAVAGSEWSWNIVRRTEVA